MPVIALNKVGRSTIQIKNLIIVCFVLLMLLLSGCADSKTTELKAKNYSDSDISGAKNEELSQCRSSNMQFEDVEIYKICRDEFYKFLKNPNSDNLKNGAYETYRYSESGENYQTSACALFKVKKAFLDFLTDYGNVQKYLSEKGTECLVRSLAVFDAPHIPITIFVSTDNNPVYLTVNEEYDDSGYVYRLYTESEYYEKFKSTNGTLKVNDKEILGTNVKIYYNYAEVPFIEVCKALGANVRRTKKETADIDFEGQKYVLDMNNNSLSKIGENENLFDTVCGGGPYFKYSADGDFYVDNETLTCAFFEMDKRIQVDLKTSDKGKFCCISEAR